MGYLEFWVYDFGYFFIRDALLFVDVDLKTNTKNKKVNS